MHRLFVALRPPLAIRDRLIDLMQGIDDARWQDDDQLHATLRYVGEVDRHVAEDIASALGRVRAPPLQLAIAGVGTFDRRGRVDTVWAGIAPREGITALHRKIDHALIATGLPPEARAFLPHITLARLNRSSGSVDGFVARNAALVSEHFGSDHFLLYESHLHRGGARYQAIARYPLTG